MKLNKRIILSLILGCYSTLIIQPVFADNNTSSDPIGEIANSQTNTDNSSSNNKNNTISSSDNNNSPTQSDSEAKPLSKKSQDAIANMLLQSVSLMGIAYKWGGNTPSTGMDCSGFVRYVYQKSLGINLPRTAAEQARVGKRISIDSLEPGDLLFFNSRRGSNTHVGIYLGNNKFIQSPRTGESIQISDLSNNWRKNFNGAKRIVQEGQDGSGEIKLQNFQDVHDEALPVSKRASSKDGRHGRRSAATSTRKGKHHSNSTAQSSSSKKKSTSKKKKKS